MSKRREKRAERSQDQGNEPEELAVADPADEPPSSDPTSDDPEALRQLGLLLSENGQEDEAITCFDKVLAINPNDSDAMRNRGVSLSKKGIEDEAITWFDQALAVNPNDSDVMRQRGISLAKKGLDDEAIAWFDKALAVNPNDYDALRERGLSLSEKGLEDEAIAWYDKALAVNPEDADAMRNRGVSLSEKGIEDDAIAWFDKALAVDPTDADAMRSRGVSLSKKGIEDEAIVWFQKALEVKPADDASLRNWAVAEYQRGNTDTAIDLMIQAVKLAPSRWRGGLRALCEVAGNDFDAVWSQAFPGEEAAPVEPKPVEAEQTEQKTDEPTQIEPKAAESRQAEPKPDTPKPVEPKPVAPKSDTPQKQPSETKTSIFPTWLTYENEMNGYLSALEAKKGKQMDFLNPKSNLDPFRSVLMVLRQSSNSYTPAVPSLGEGKGRGGGYFIWHGGRGTVIDPGYDFIENFCAAGCRVCDIDNIILTHAHNDSTIDFETLCALLHDYNDQEASGTRRKKVRLYLSNGAFMKFSGMIRLNNTDYLEHVFTLNADTAFELADDMHLRVLTAYHDELTARDQSVGLLLTVAGGNLLFTGDTGLFPLDKGAAKLASDTTGPEVWQRYPERADGHPLQPDLMLVHIGPVKETELKADAAKDPRAVCYPNHLGVVGTTRLITACLPKLAVVSAFDAEMKRFRLPLMEGMQKNVVDRYCEEHATPTRPRVVPGDLPFIYDIKKHAVYSCVSKQWEKPETVAFDVDPAAREPVIYFFSEDDRAKFESKADYWARTFESDRDGREQMYFQR